jgi:hypothetical protein
MADFEELKLTVNLVDNASAGLTNIRTQLTQLTQTAGQVQTAFAGVATNVQQVGKAAGEAAPKVSSQEKALKELSHSAEETTRGLVGMALAARRGAEAWPELILATREAWTGMKSVGVVMGELGAASRLMVVGLGGVAIGIAAVGAAVVAYGVSVFKFSREMYTLSQTAKSLGMTFGSVKALTEQNEAFGISIDNTVSGLARMQATMADLSVSGSQLRQQMIGMGVPPQRIDEIVRETDVIKRRNMVIDDQIKIEADLQKRMGKEAAAEWTNRYGNWFGVDPGARSRPRQQPQTEEEKKQAEYIADQSTKIAVEWAKVLDSVSKIKTEFLAWGLPHVLTIVEKIATAFDKISQGMDKAKKDDPGHQFVPNKSIFGRTLNWDWSAGTGVKPPPETPATPKAATPEAAPADPPKGLGHLRRIPPLGYHPSSYEGANDNRSLLHNASFGDGFGGSDVGGSSGEGRAQAIIKGGVYEALIQFYGFLRGGGTGGGGGVQNASLTTGGGLAVGGGGGGAASFGSPEFPNLGTSYGVGGRPHGSHVGAGSGDGAGESPAGAPGGGGGPGRDGSSTPPSGNLAAQRAGFMKELNDNPRLKAFAIDAMQHEGGIQSNMEQLFNYAAMRHMTINQALHSGQYGPVKRGLISGNISEKTRRAGEAALQSVGAGSNITDYATDQGMAGDPNFAKYMSNRDYWHMHKVQGAWFSAHGERGRQWAERQRAADAKSASDTSKSVAASAAVPGAAGGPGPVGERYSTRRLQGEGGEGQDQTGGGQGGSDAEGGGNLKRIYIRPQLDRSSLNDGPLDRSALNDNNRLHSTGKLDVSVNAPPGTKVAYNGNNLLKNTSMQRQTQMMPTSTGPSVADASQSYMRGGT